MRLKQTLNRTASSVLAGVGYSGAMASDAKREGWWWLQARAGAARRRSGLLRAAAVVWADVGRAELVGIDVPRAAGNEVTVRVLASTVSSGTERAQYLRLPNAVVEFPFVPGYSAAGVVVERGKGVSSLEVGQLVAMRGVGHVSAATVAASTVFPVPPGVDAHAASTVALGVICRQGVRLANVARDKPFCVIGAGPIGLLAQRLATAEGAGPATVVARTSRNAARALAGGAAFLALEDGDPPGEFPIVIEATGAADAFALAVSAAAPGGRIVLLGSMRGLTHAVPLDELRHKQLTVVGAHVETLAHEGRARGEDLVRREAELYLSALAEGRVEVDDLVDTVVDPREADAFYRTLARNKDIAAASFDWSRLPDAEAAAPTRFARLPDLRARGVEPERRPLAARVRVSAASSSGGGRPLGIGLLGCGDIAVHNAAAVAAAPNAQLVACYDPVTSLAEDVAGTYGAVATETSEALLERGDVNAVFLAVPHHLHAPLALQAIDAGKHVVVEKPLANTLANARDIVEAAERGGVVLTVCFPHRYQPNVVAAKRLIEAGAIGAFGGVLVNAFADKPESYWHAGFSGRASSDWRSSREKAGGGFLIMNLSHQLDLLLHLAGIDVESCSATTQLGAAAAEVEDAVALTLKFANGGIGTVFGSSALRGHHAPRTDFQLWGDDGYLVVEPEPRIYTVRALEGIRPARWHVLELETQAEIRTTFVTRFAAAVSRGGAPDVTPTQALAVQALIEAGYRASETGAAVSPADLLEGVAV